MLFFKDIESVIEGVVRQNFLRQVEPPLRLLSVIEGLDIVTQADPLICIFSRQDNISVIGVGLVSDSVDKLIVLLLVNDLPIRVDPLNDRVFSVEAIFDLPHVRHKKLEICELRPSLLY